MYNENYSIVFSSMTGNTRKLADKIHEILPKESCDYFGTADAQGDKIRIAIHWILDGQGKRG